MKNGKNPKLKQMQILQKNHMNPEEWLIVKVMSDRLECINRRDGKAKSAFLKVNAI